MPKNVLGKAWGHFFRSSWKKKIIVLIVIVAVGFFVGKRFFNKSKDGYIFDTVQKRTVVETVSESGIVTTNGSVNIYSPTNGVIEEVYVSNNDNVSERQKLFTVKSTATPQEKAAALAAYKVASSAVQQAENTRRSTTATVERVHDDVKDNDDDESFLQKETRTTAEVANDNAYDALLAARAQLTSALSAYQATQNSTVTAPVEGIVSNLSVVSGSSVLVNSSFSPTSAVLIIDSLGATEVIISVGENDINKIKIGQEVAIEADAIYDKVYKGVIRRADETGTITQGIVNFNVYIEVINPDENLKAGMTVDADIVTNELTNVLSVPSTAVKPYQKGRAVRKLGKNGEIIYTPIIIGVKGKDFTQIIEGLKEGEEIVVSLTNEKVETKSPFGF